MKSIGVMGKAGIVLLLLNEIRGILVVLSVLGAWSHAGKAAPLDSLSALAHHARPTVSALGAGAAPAGQEPRRRAGS